MKASTTPYAVRISLLTATYALCLLACGAQLPKGQCVILRSFTLHLVCILSSYEHELAYTRNHIEHFARYYTSYPILRANHAISKLIYIVKHRDKCANIYLGNLDGCMFRLQTTWNACGSRTLWHILFTHSCQCAYPIDSTTLNYLSVAQAIYLNFVRRRRRCWLTTEMWRSSLSIVVLWFFNIRASISCKIL